MSDTENIRLVIVRYLDGNMDDADSLILENWLSESNENSRSLHSVSQIWKASEDKSQEALLNELNLEKDWERISDHIEKSNKKAKDERVLKFKRLRKRHQLVSNLIKVAALILVALTSGFLTLQYAPQQQEQVYEPVFNEIQTNAAERARIELGDGSEVTLNSESKLIVPENFGQKAREVELYGQAFFDVESEERRPFRIKSQSGVIEVLGTSFDVRSYSDEDVIEVVVREGTVEVSREDNKEQRMIVNEGYIGSIKVSENKMNLKWVEDPGSYFAWMEGRLVFKDDPLKKVFRHIERIYDIKITYSGTDESILQKEFSADLKTRSVTEVMDVIKMAMDIEYEVNGDRVIIN